jgi:hypothetical protein
MIWLNYALLLQFAVLSIGWLISGDKIQAFYWFGAFACNAAVTFR